MKGVFSHVSGATPEEAAAIAAVLARAVTGTASDAPAEISPWRLAALHEGTGRDALRRGESR